jgi:hypothetical protein
MALKLSNNATGFLAATIAATDTTIALQPGQGAAFPALAAGDWCPGTLLGANGAIEIVRITAHSNDSFTVERAQEGTAAQAFNAGSRFEHRLTAGAIASIQTDVQSRLPAAGGEITGNLTVDGTLNGGTPWTSANFTPANKLDVTGGAITGSLTIGGTLNGGTPYTSANFNPATKLDLAGGAMTGNLVSAPIAAPMAVNDSNGPIRVQNNGGTGDNNAAMMVFLAQNQYGIKMGIRADGYFGLGGWSRAAWSWYSDPSGNMVAAGNVSAYSDPRLKDDVERIAGALSIVEQLDGVRFTWNSKTKLVGRPGKRDIGVLADQVEGVLPELVSLSVPDEANGGEQWRVVAYDKLVPVLIEAVKELAAEVRMMHRGL